MINHHQDNEDHNHAVKVINDGYKTMEVRGQLVSSVSLDVEQNHAHSVHLDRNNMSI